MDDLYALNDVLSALLRDWHGWEPEDEADYDALNELTHGVDDLIRKTITSH